MNNLQAVIKSAIAEVNAHGGRLCVWDDPNRPERYYWTDSRMLPVSRGIRRIKTIERNTQESDQ